MTNTGGPGKPRKFAAKYQYKWQGWVAIVLGVSALGSAEIFTGIIGILLIVGGVYLLRGQGTSPAQEAKRKAKADKLQSQIDHATSSLASAKGGAAVVAYRRLESLIKNTKTADAQERFDAILAAIKFDPKSIESKFIGSIPRAGAWKIVNVEIYKDWIISLDESFDVDISTRAEVHVDGTITYDAKNNKIDNRTATIQFVSTDWSTSFGISPDRADDARRMASQLMAVIEELKPKGVTTADISELMKSILNASGQPAAQKLQQLSDLRYQRLLTDEEFEAAKAKVLGI
jgi:hypothetical protein